MSGTAPKSGNVVERNVEIENILFLLDVTPRDPSRVRQWQARPQGPPGASGPKRYQIGVGLSFGMSFEGREINHIQISRQFRLRRSAEKPWKDIPKDSPTRKRRALPQPERPSPSSATARPIVSVQQAIWGVFFFSTHRWYRQGRSP